MAKRKRVAPALRDLTEVENVLAGLCALRAERDETEASMNQALIRAREAHEPVLTEIGEREKAMELSVEQFALSNRDQIFGGKKSVGLTHGTLSFRLSNPSCVLASRKWKWDLVIASLKK